MIMEIPLEVMISTSLEAPWVFYPDFLPLGHPLFEVINSTDAEVSTSLLFSLHAGARRVGFMKGNIVSSA